MSQSPQRPYVPHRTPTDGQPAISTSDFMVSKPFVPDADLVRNSLMATPGESAAGPTESAVPSIESFLVTARTGVAQSAESFERGIDDELETQPPLEHFLDPLPPISDFSSDSAKSYAESPTDFPDTSVGKGSSPPTESEW
ncbi:MAG TPA: hypothetical protein VJS39_12345, partial [Gemmatimonadaceae bacterium]|nr:hypothetical protein [Gemmatimonadaceae bacterium]